MGLADYGAHILVYGISISLHTLVLSLSHLPGLKWNLQFWQVVQRTILSIEPLHCRLQPGTWAQLILLMFGSTSHRVYAQLRVEAGLSHEIVKELCSGEGLESNGSILSLTEVCACVKIEYSCIALFVRVVLQL